MTTQGLDPIDQFRRMVADGRLSAEALQAITGISSHALDWVLQDAPSGAPGMTAAPMPLTGDENSRLSALAAQLLAVFEIDDDSRLRGIIESLTAQCRLTYENIALLTHVELDDVERFMRDPEAVPQETKYALAIRASFLINAVANAMPRRAG